MQTAINMQKLLWHITFILMFCIPFKFTHAQDSLSGDSSIRKFKHGIETSVIYLPKITGDNISYSKPTVGFGLGAYIKKELSNKWALIYGIEIDHGTHKYDQDISAPHHPPASPHPPGVINHDVTMRVKTNFVYYNFKFSIQYTYPYSKHNWNFFNGAGLFFGPKEPYNYKYTLRVPVTDEEFFSDSDRYFPWPVAYMSYFDNVSIFLNFGSQYPLWENTKLIVGLNTTFGIQSFSIFSDPPIFYNTTGLNFGILF